MTTSDFKILVFEPVAEPNPEDLESLRNGLRAYNESKIGKYKDKKIALFVKNDQKKVVAGIYATLLWDWIHIEWLWVSEELRGKGTGSRLINQIEEYALKNDIHRFLLETGSFQALDFYIKNGFEIFGEIKDMPPGHISYYLKKEIIGRKNFISITK